MNSVLPILRPPFVPFEDHRAIRIYQRSLPHWRQDGVTYLVTFRLGDSIPHVVRQRWEEEKSAWLGAHGIHCDRRGARWRAALEKLPAAQQARFQEHFNRRVQSCLDRGLGRCWLRKPACIEIVRDELLADDGRRYHTGDFVIMPNHVHMLITPARGEKLEMILKRMKGASAVDCNRLLGRTGMFWQADSYDHIVRSLEQLQQCRRYIVANPSKAGITSPGTASYVAVWMDEWLRS